MFMTFIAISILSAVFITMYLYLLRASTMATEAQRLYAEAAQERLEVIYNPAEENLTIRNTGGISVVLKYLVERDESAGQAKIMDFAEKLSNTVLSPNETTWIIYSKSNAENELLIVTERGNVFRAQEAAQTGPGIGQFVMKLSQYEITISPGDSQQITLTLIADPAYEGDPVQISVWSLQELFLWTFWSPGCPSGWTCEISPNPVNLSPETPSTAVITISVPSWESEDDYYLRFEGVGSGGETEYVTLKVTVSRSPPPGEPYVEINVQEDSVSGNYNQKRSVTVEVISHNGYSGTVTLSYQERAYWPYTDVISTTGKNLGFKPSDTVTLSPGATKLVTFKFRVRGNGEVTISGTADPDAIVDSDKFTVSITG